MQPALSGGAGSVLFRVGKQSGTGRRPRAHALAESEGRGGVRRAVREVFECVVEVFSSTNPLLHCWLEPSKNIFVPNT